VLPACLPSISTSCLVPPACTLPWCVISSVLALCLSRHWLLLPPCLPHQLPRASQLRGLAAAAKAAPAAAAPRDSPDPYTTAPRNYIQLLQHIQRAKDLDRLEALLRSYGGRFDAVHVAAAMVAVPKLMKVVHPGGVRVSAAVAKQRSRQPAYLMAELQVSTG
jgi:hypothetical protein